MVSPNAPQGPQAPKPADTPNPAPKASEVMVSCRWPTTSFGPFEGMDEDFYVTQTPVKMSSADADKIKELGDRNMVAVVIDEVAK